MLKVDKLKVTLGHNSYCYSLSIAAGECVAILGESGSGKSTLLNLISGFLNATDGALSWKGENINQLRPADRPVTTLFQDHNLFSHLTLFDNVALGINAGLSLSRSETLLVKQTLQSTGLDDLAKRLPAELSGGQSQRAALARCLLRKKPILLLDEPFSALDEHTRHEMLTLTKQVHNDNQLCTILVTHNPVDAERLASRTLTIINGELNEKNIEHSHGKPASL